MALSYFIYKNSGDTQGSLCRNDWILEMTQETVIPGQIRSERLEISLRRNWAFKAGNNNHVDWLVILSSTEHLP